MQHMRAPGTALVLVDFQERLLAAMPDRETLTQRVLLLLRGFRVLGRPVCVTEQIPEKLGPTAPEAMACLSAVAPIMKSAFSCAKEPAFLEWLPEADCSHILLAGIESHVCVYQTARDLVELGYHVSVAADAVCSRKPVDQDHALATLRQEGIRVVTVEMALFDLLERAGTSEFREILKWVKISERQ